VLLRILSGKIDRRKIMEHLVTVGLDSLRAVLLIAFFAGMIFTIQSARELIRFGAVGAVGGAFALAFCRELAPVLTAGVVAGQVGSAFAAEIGEMQVTEQIDALYMLRTNPVDYLVVPRVIACCVMLPILTYFFGGGGDCWWAVCSGCFLWFGTVGIFGIGAVLFWGLGI
jgi:ABC-type transport system involved in resistance to organic solvents, permease component